ncbi:MAG: hypothetical protein JSW70_09965, partial [Syntrophobacterales bacterium]
TYRFFRDGIIPHCQAGKRFLVVRPDGYLNPCSMFPEEQYVTQSEVLRKFTAQNECGECYVAIRAYTEKSPWQLARESFGEWERLARLRESPRSAQLAG